MRAYTGHHYRPRFPTIEEIDEARKRAEAMEQRRRELQAKADDYATYIRTLPDGKQTLVSRLLAHITNVRTSRRTKDRAAAQLETELSLPVSFALAEILARVFPKPETHIHIEAAKIAGEQEVAP